MLPTVVGKLFENSLTEATVGASQSMLPMRNGLLASMEQLHPELAVFWLLLGCVWHGSPASLGLVSYRMDALRGSES